MALKYRDAFGLRDNPFGPRLPWGTVPPVLTVELEKRPLLVHKNSGLDALYCEKLPSFKSACENLEILIEANGYSIDHASGEVTRGTSPYLVGIEGDRGSGKTTLASRMMQLMMKRTPTGQPPWHVEELMLKSATQTANEQGDQLKALETRVLAAKQAYNCILVDDLRPDAFPFATQVYDKLLEHCVVFMVFTSYDAKMSEQIDKSLHSVRRVQIAGLTPDDAIAYVDARYKLFRLPSTNGINAVPLFPFDEPDLRTAVQVKTLSGSLTGAVNLRLVASILEAALSNRLQEIAKKTPTFDVHTLAAQDLQQMLIKVAQSYSSVVRR